jgi:PAS domain S-box-containing protein
VALLMFSFLAQQSARRAEMQAQQDLLESKVRERTAALRESEMRFKAIAEHSPDHLLVQDRDLRYQFVMNPQMGLTEQDMLGKTDDDFLAKEDADKLKALKRQVLEAGQPLHVETPLISHSGEQIWFDGTYVPRLNEAGQVDGLIGYFRNVTERKRIEALVSVQNEELRRRSAELVAANKELEAFAYSVSHDLRVPLRAVDGFSSMLEKKYREALGDEGRRLIGVIRDSAQKMGRLIDDILAFSRIGRREVARQKVDMKALVRAMYEELAPNRAGRNIQFEVGDIPPAMGDPSMLQQVWVNLISNAIKFTRHAASARIEVGAMASELETTYFVRDNGVGFDMQYYGKLFGVFQRLHGVEEFEGTGIGLAIVHRIVVRHGGRVWAEGRVGEGATFFFSLPNEGQSAMNEGASMMGLPENRS